LESHFLGNISERWWKVAIFEGEHAKNSKILKKNVQNEVKYSSSDHIALGF